LQQSEEKYRTMIEYSNDMIWTLDKKGNFLYFNKRSEELTGYKIKDGVGKTFVPIILEEDLEMVQNVFLDTLAGNPNHYEVRIHDSTKTKIITLSVNTAPIIKDGKVTGTVSFGRDITKSKQAEEALRESEKQLQTLIDAMPDFVCFKDGDGRWLKVNDACIRIFQLEGIDYRGKKDSELAELNNKLRGAFLTCKETDAKAWKEGGLIRGEEIVPDSDGSVRIFDVTKVAVSHPGGERKGLVVIGHDITERKKAEQELKELNINLEKRVQEAVAEIREKENMLIAQSRLATMGEMIGNIAHQWRQPLTAVGIIVQNYEDDYEAGILDMKYLEEHSDNVMDILQQMSITIDDFRNFFKPNKLIQEFNISVIIEKTISFVKASFRLNSIKLELNLEESCYIEGFPNEYSQVILNILNNAKDVIKELNIKIENRKIIINLYKENGKSVVTIVDTGGGIPEDIMGRIFEPYFTTKSDETGTGLGLYMSKAIIEENMKGKLTVRNIKDGAEFRIEI